jgi:hypothetical protein
LGNVNRPSLVATIQTVRHFGIPRRRREGNIKMDIRETDVKVGTGFSWKG